MPILGFVIFGVEGVWLGSMLLQYVAASLPQLFVILPNGMSEHSQQWRDSWRHRMVRQALFSYYAFWVVVYFILLSWVLKF